MIRLHLQKYSCNYLDLQNCNVWLHSNVIFPKIRDVDTKLKETIKMKGKLIEHLYKGMNL